MGRVHGVSGEVCWGVGGGEGSCGKRYGGVGEVCWGVGRGKERCVGSGEGVLLNTARNYKVLLNFQNA